MAPEEINTVLLAACKAAYLCHVFDFQHGTGISWKEAKMLAVKDQLHDAIATAAKGK